jgi:hypothetical protein
VPQGEPFTVRATLACLSVKGQVQAYRAVKLPQLATSDHGSE